VLVLLATAVDGRRHLQTANNATSGSENQHHPAGLVAIGRAD
jgi:hypothetical protein